MPVNAKFGIDLSVNDKSAKGVKSAEANFNRLGVAGHDVYMGVRSATSAIGGALTTAAGEASKALHGLAGAGLSFLDRIERLGERSRQDQVSPKGARGVMQLMPGTARDVARSLGQPFDENRFRNDAGYSRMLGDRYAQDQLRRFGGDDDGGGGL